MEANLRVDTFPPEKAAFVSGTFRAVAADPAGWHQGSWKARTYRHSADAVSATYIRKANQHTVIISKR